MTTKEIIKELLVDKQMSANALSKKSDIASSTLNDFLTGKVKDIGWSKIQKIANTLDVTTDSLKDFK